MGDPTQPTLSRLEPSLPSRSYFDPEQYQRELEAIWYRNWLCIGRIEELSEPRDYKVVEVGSQSILVTRDHEGRLHAFHNTCRHRGSVLCTQERGRLPGNAIVCPYHTSIRIPTSRSASFWVCGAATSRCSIVHRFSPWPSPGAMSTSRSTSPSYRQCSRSRAFPQVVAPSANPPPDTPTPVVRF